jgi:hypothetical protein
MPFTSDTFTHLFDWEKDPQRQEKIVNARLEAEFDGLDTALSTLKATNTALTAPQYAVAAASSDLANERVLTDTATVTWDFSVAGQAKANASTTTNPVTAAATFANDNRFLRSDGTGRGAQSSPVTCDDSGNMMGVATITTSGNIDSQEAGFTTRGPNGGFAFYDRTTNVHSFISYSHVPGGYVFTDIVGGASRMVFDGAVLQFPTVGTTAAGANTVLNSAAGNSVLRSTSSARYKTDILDISQDDLAVISRLRPIKYRSTAIVDDPQAQHFGLIAEEVHQIDPRLVHYGYRDEDYDNIVERHDGRTIGARRVLKDGSVRVPDGVQYERIVPLLIKTIQKVLDRVSALEARTPAATSSKTEAQRR